MRRARRGPGTTREGGFSLVELLLVMVVLGILAQVAIPNYQAIMVKARAVDLIADIEVVEQAARSYQGDALAWPADSPTGVIPPGLGPYLPDGFSFVGEEHRLDWESIATPGGLPGSPGTSRILGVGVVTDNVELGRALVELMGDSGWYLVGTSYIRIIDRE